MEARDQEGAKCQAVSQGTAESQTKPGLKDRELILDTRADPQAANKETQQFTKKVFFARSQGWREQRAEAQPQDQIGSGGTQQSTKNYFYKAEGVEG